jgi:[acyl-carrier-protein] S-malonyltransferase
VTPRRVFVLFPGQGAQSVGMVGAEPPLVLEHASRVLDLDLVEVMRSGPKSLLDSTRFSQLSVFAHSWASFLVLRERRPELFGPSAVGVERSFAGLSLGEYTALAAAGALEFEDALRLVSKRADAMQAASEQRHGVMVTLVGVEGATVEATCAQYAGPGAVRVANFLFPKAVVVSGDTAAVAWVEAEVKATAAVSGATLHCKALAVGGAFHTELMRPALAPLSQALDDAAFKPVPPANTVFTNVTGARYADVNDRDQVRRTLLAQLVGPVQWEATLTAIVSGFREGDLLFEVGPGKQIGAMLKRMGASKGCLAALSSVAIESLPPTTAASGRPVLARALSFSSASQVDDSEQHADAMPTLKRAQASPEASPVSPPGLSRASSSYSLLSSDSLSRASSSASLLASEGLSRVSSSTSLLSTSASPPLMTPAALSRADSFRSTISTSSLTPTRSGALSRFDSFNSTSSVLTPTELTPTRPAVEPPRFQRKGSIARHSLELF